MQHRYDRSVPHNGVERPVASDEFYGVPVVQPVAFVLGQELIEELPVFGLQGLIEVDDALRLPARREALRIADHPNGVEVFCGRGLCRLGGSLSRHELVGHRRGDRNVT